MGKLELPFPPKDLSGHHNVHWRVLQPVKKKHREWAKAATLAAGITVPGLGDIPIRVTFIPPDRRSDRVNMPNRMKPYFDGIADALGVNDRRFLPEYHFADPEAPGCVKVEIGKFGDSEAQSVNKIFTGGASHALTGMSPDETEAA